jgi:hypothetical protein
MAFGTMFNIIFFSYCRQSPLSSNQCNLASHDGLFFPLFRLLSVFFMLRRSLWWATRHNITLSLVAACPERRTNCHKQSHAACYDGYDKSLQVAGDLVHLGDVQRAGQVDGRRPAEQTNSCNCNAACAIFMLYLFYIC